MQLSFEGCEPASSMPKSHARLGTPAFRKPGEDRLLLPNALDEEIPEGHPVRMIKWAVQHVDLSAIKKRYEHKGGIPYLPSEPLGSRSVWNDRGNPLESGSRGALSIRSSVSVLDGRFDAGQPNVRQIP